jgi:hypothetical protein
MENQRLRLFVWRGKGVLENYSTGTVIAYAKTCAQARNMVRAQIFEMYEFMGPIYGEDNDWWVAKLGFLGRDPEVFENAVAFCIPGSD